MKKAFPLFVAAGFLLAGAAARAEKAQSVPVSDKIIKLEVQAPDGHWIKGAVREGDQFRIEDHVLNVTMALVPITTDSGIRFRTFRIEDRGEGNESMHFVEEFETGLGETAYTRKARIGLGVKVREVVVPKEDLDPRTPVLKGCGKAGKFLEEGYVQPGRCCVTCGGTTSCGCAVEDTCGTCCSGGCCYF
jgi:hypothetical protein